MININLQSRLSTVIIGLLIFFTPFFTFLSQNNLRQLSASDVLEILLSLLIVLSVIFISSFSFELLIKKILKKKIILFPFFCLAFYVNFLYMPFSEFVLESLITSFGDSIMNPETTFLTLTHQEATFILFELSCLALILLGAKFNILALRVTLIFSIFMIITALIPLISFLTEATEKKSLISYEIEGDILVQDEVLVKRNIYYIILDGMLALDPASEFNIISKKETLNTLSSVKLKYIDQSMSSYSGTYMTLASLMLVDFPHKPGSPKYLNTSNFFPRMMALDKAEVPLISFLNKANSSFIWSGNTWASCNPSKQWSCINSSSELATKKSSKFYLTTPFIMIYKRIFNTSNNSSIDKFLKYIDKNDLTKKPFFAFIHHFSPHSPHLVTSDCEPTNSSKYFNRNFEGYKASYACVLKTVQILMEKIITTDPQAIVVFQGDHGWFGLDRDFNEKEKYLLRGKIFNAIKAPELCFQKYGLPRTTINTIRFTLNCAYGFKLPYHQDIHYQTFYEEDPNYGIVIERKIYE